MMMMKTPEQYVQIAVNPSDYSEEDQKDALLFWTQIAMAVRSNTEPSLISSGPINQLTPEEENDNIVIVPLNRRRRKCAARRKMMARKTGATKFSKLAKLLLRKSGCTKQQALQTTGWKTISMHRVASATNIKLTSKKVGSVTRYYGQQRRA